MKQIKYIDIRPEACDGNSEVPKSDKSLNSILKLFPNTFLGLTNSDFITS